MKAASVAEQQEQKQWTKQQQILHSYDGEEAEEADPVHSHWWAAQ